MIYQYRSLTESGKIFEVDQSMKDEALTEYEEATPYIMRLDGKVAAWNKKKHKVERIITGGCGTIFKGDGWCKPSK